MKVKKNVRRP